VTTLCLSDLNLDAYELQKTVDTGVNGAGLSHASISDGDFVLDLLAACSRYQMDPVKCLD